MLRKKLKFYLQPPQEITVFKLKPITMKPQYKFKVDMPDAKKGTLLNWDEKLNCYIYNKTSYVGGSCWTNSLTAVTVQQSPEWFEEVKEGAKHPIEYLGGPFYNKQIPIMEAQEAINTAMIDAYNKAIDDCCMLLLDSKCQTLIIKAKDFKF